MTNHGFDWPQSNVGNLTCLPLPKNFAEGFNFSAIAEIHARTVRFDQLNGAGIDLTALIGSF